MLQLKEILDLRTLDLEVYKLGWTQPPANPHRTSGVPSYILKDPPENITATYKNAIAILDGKETLAIPDVSLRGDDFLKCMDDILEELKEEERKKIIEKVKVEVEKFLISKSISYRYVF